MKEEISKCCRASIAIVHPTNGFGAKSHPPEYKACSKCAKKLLEKDITTI